MEHGADHDLISQCVVQLTAEAVRTGDGVDPAIAGGENLAVGDVVVDGDPGAAGHERAVLEALRHVVRLHGGYHRAHALALL